MYENLPPPFARGDAHAPFEFEIRGCCLGKIVDTTRPHYLHGERTSSREPDRVSQRCRCNVSTPFILVLIDSMKRTITDRIKTKAWTRELETLGHYAAYVKDADVQVVGFVSVLETLLPSL